MFSTRSLLFALVATAAATLVARPALADATVKVPFKFMVDGKQCPAGRYLIKGDSQTHIVTLVGRDSSKIFSWIVFPNTGDENDRSVVLHFEQSGAEQVLRSIQYGTQSTLRLKDHTATADEMESESGGR